MEHKLNIDNILNRIERDIVYGDKIYKSAILNISGNNVNVIDAKLSTELINIFLEKPIEIIDETTIKITLSSYVYEGDKVEFQIIKENLRSVPGIYQEEDEQREESIVNFINIEKNNNDAFITQAYASRFTEALEEGNHITKDSAWTYNNENNKKVAPMMYVTFFQNHAYTKNNTKNLATPDNILSYLKKHNSTIKSNGSLYLYIKKNIYIFQEEELKIILEQEKIKSPYTLKNYRIQNRLYSRINVIRKEFVNQEIQHMNHFFMALITAKSAYDNVGEKTAFSRKENLIEHILIRSEDVFGRVDNYKIEKGIEKIILEYIDFSTILIDNNENLKTVKLELSKKMKKNRKGKDTEAFPFYERLTQSELDNFCNKRDGRARHLDISVYDTYLKVLGIIEKTDKELKEDGKLDN